MRESTGNALLMTLMTSVVAVVLSFLVGSISYSKSYRVKNHIINEIEDRKGWSAELQKDVDSYLKDIGYKVSKKETCPSAADIYKEPGEGNRKDASAKKCTNNLHEDSGSYNYCVYQCTENSYTFYVVITYMHMDFPLVNKFVNFKIMGETKSFY